MIRSEAPFAGLCSFGLRLIGAGGSHHPGAQDLRLLGIASDWAGLLGSCLLESVYNHQSYKCNKKVNLSKLISVLESGHGAASVCLRGWTVCFWKATSELSTSARQLLKLLGDSTKALRFHKCRTEVCVPPAPIPYSTCLRYSPDVSLTLDLRTVVRVTLHRFYLFVPFAAHLLVAFPSLPHLSIAGRYDTFVTHFIAKNNIQPEFKLPLPFCLTQPPKSYREPAYRDHIAFPSMFRRMWSGLPKDPEYPPDLKGLG